MSGVYQAEYDVDAIRLPKVATDDSHRGDHIGRAWIEVNAARNPDAILRAIKAGDFAVVILAALALCLAAALYPAWRASCLEPVDAIRRQA
jgi:ABC-type lipoprotein release transport system permease subunit